MSIDRMSLRLLSINNYFYRRGGAEMVFLEHNRLFTEVGWEVVPFAMHHRKNKLSPWSSYFVKEIEFGKDYSLLQKAVCAQKITYSIEARRKIGTVADRIKPNIAHAHNVYHHISPSIFGALRNRGTPVVLSLHDLKLVCPAYKMLTHDGICERCRGGAIWNVVRHRCVKDSLALSTVILYETAVQRLFGFYARNVDRFVVPSLFYLEKFVQWGWGRERFSYVPNFVDLEAHLPDSSPGSAFLYFGRLGHEKGLRTLVQAGVLASVPVHIVGAGPEERALRKLAGELGGEVAFLGYRTGAELDEAIRAARAVVLPSEWYENAPMSIMEAYALGRPVIGARIGGIPELIRHGETGAVFESGNAEDLADVMRQFTNMEDSAVADMGRQGRRWVEMEFTAQKYRYRILELYRELGVRF